MHRFAIIEGHYLYASLHHGGQGCPLYARLCRIGEYFKPGPMWSESRILEPDDPFDENRETREVYANLVGLDITQII